MIGGDRGTRLAAPKARQQAQGFLIHIPENPSLRLAQTRELGGDATIGVERGLVAAGADHAGELLLKKNHRRAVGARRRSEGLGRAGVNRRLKKTQPEGEPVPDQPGVEARIEKPFMGRPFEEAFSAKAGQSFPHRRRGEPKAAGLLDHDDRLTRPVFSANRAQTQTAQGR